MQAKAILDHEAPLHGRLARLGHPRTTPFAERLRSLAQKMWSRPYCRMKAANSRSSIVPRALAALSNIGMFTPATTSARREPATVRARLVAVSPSISVRINAPSPSSLRSITRRSLALTTSGSDSTVDTASILDTGPITPSSVRTISSPRRPCVTTTIPIIKSLRDLTGNVAMPHLHAITSLRQTSADLLRQHDRAMPTAGTAYGEREIRFALVQVSRKEKAQQRLRMLEKLLRLRALHHVVDHRWLEPGVRP